ncbi:MAG: hypothetical protein EBR40_06020 [Proteobacteria bacterium]|nr:hypothetical protein [Pseudomonadota bacterium]
MNFINTSIVVLTASLALLTLHAEDNSVPLSRLPIPLELMPPDIGESDSPSTPSEALSSVPITATNSPAPALEDRERAELSLERQEIVSAREQLRSAFRANPADAPLRARCAWFLYSNGFHDKECLSLLEESLRNGSASDPAGVFNAIIEVRAELNLPTTMLRNPEQKLPAKKTIVKSTLSEMRVKKHSDSKTIAKPVSEERFRRWVFTPYYSYSYFNHGRQPWQEEFAQILYKVNKRLILGAEVDVMERPPSGTNTYYSALFSWYLLKTLELHGKISICPAPTFAATQIYSGGAAWQALPRLGILLDYQHYNFIWGPIDQINPGLVWSFNDKTWLTARYVRGWAFYNLQFNYYSTALNLGLPGNRRLTMAFAYGTDPDAQIGADGTTNTNLSPAYTYSVFLTQPLTRDLNLFAGIQYCYRLTQYGGGELYEQITPTLGCSLQF